MSRILTRQQVRRGAYHNVSELIAAIEHFIAGYSDRARPFVWTKSAEDVLAKAKRQDTSGTEHSSSTTISATSPSSSAPRTMRAGRLRPRWE